VPASTAAYVAPEGDYTLSTTLVGASDGRNYTAVSYWPVRTPRKFKEKQVTREPLVTGLRVIDVLFPIAKGGSAAVPGGFGTGKTMTQHAIAKWCDADIIVYIGCGERGNEMTEVLTEFPTLIDPRTGRSLMERTILIANTSNMPVAAREVSIYTGITIAEYYRDMGYHVAVMADSTSRWAEALRELSGRLEEMPAEEGFPAYLADPPRGVLRAGRHGHDPRRQKGLRHHHRCSLAARGRFFRACNAAHEALYSVLLGAGQGPRKCAPLSGDLVERFLQRVHRGPYRLLGRHRSRLGQPPFKDHGDSEKERRLADIVRLIGPDALPDEQRLILLTADMIKAGFLQQSSFDNVDMYCAPPKQTLLLTCILTFHELAEQAIEHGSPLIKISALPIREKIIRLKSSLENERVQEGQAVIQEIRAAFAQLGTMAQGAVSA